MMADTAISHIWQDDRGVAWIDDTNTKVIEVALDQFVHGWSAEEIHLQHRHLSLGQIHAALSYFYDHQEELSRQITEAHRAGVALRELSATQPSREALRQKLTGSLEERKSA